MKFEYTGRHIEVTPALRAHVEEHFGRISDLFNGDNAKAHIIIEVERNRHSEEIIVNWHSEVITATTVNSDMYQSLSKSIDKIEKQARRLKNKIIDKSHKRQKVSAVIPPTEDVVPEQDAPRIIPTRRYAVKPMTAEEAAMRLDQEENQFLVFRNAENEKIAIIYRRKDKNFGLIEPK